jgi:hypothetical protein
MRWERPCALSHDELQAFLQENPVGCKDSAFMPYPEVQRQEPARFAPGVVEQHEALAQQPTQSQKDSFRENSRQSAGEETSQNELVGIQVALTLFSPLIYVVLPEDTDR